MRPLPTITLASLLIFLISAFYYFSPSPPKNYFERKKKRKIIYKTFKSLGKIEEKKKAQLINEVNETYIKSFDDAQAKRFLNKYEAEREKVCLASFNVFEDAPEFMMETSWIYKDQTKFDNFIDKIGGQLDNTGEILFREHHKDFQSIYTHGGKVDAETILNLENLHVGCNNIESVGVLILSAAEKARNKGWNMAKMINQVARIVEVQLRFDSYQSLIFSIGMLSNLNTAHVFTEYETYDLNALREDLIVQSMEFRDSLMAAKSPEEKLEILQKARLEREIMSQMLREFVEALRARYPDF